MNMEAGKITAHKDPKLPAAPVVSEQGDWAGKMRSISVADAETLAAAIRAMYPHDGLAERIYRRVVVHLDDLGAASITAAKTLQDFCVMVSEGWPLAFAELAETYQVQALKKQEATPAFRFVQRAAVRYLYDDVEVWTAFGYEGASVHLGGYVTRGFDDLDWLPPLPNDL